MSSVATFGMLIFLMAMWGYSFVGIKLLLRTVDPINLTILRFAIVLFAIVLMMVIDLIRGRVWPKLDRSTFWRLVVLGLIGVAGYHLSLNTGEMYTSATIASIVVFTSPIFALLLSARLLGEKITKAKVFGIIIALTGVILITLLGQGKMSLSLKSLMGAVIVLGAPVSWAIYTVLGKKFSESVPAFVHFTFPFTACFLEVFF